MDGFWRSSPEAVWSGRENDRTASEVDFVAHEGRIQKQYSRRGSLADSINSIQSDGLRPARPRVEWGWSGVGVKSETAGEGPSDKQKETGRRMSRFLAADWINSLQSLIIRPALWLLRPAGTRRLAG